MEYLRHMTNHLTKLYKDKILHAHRMDDVKSMKSQVSFDDIISKTEQFLIPFEEFSTQTDKNKVSATS